MPARKECSPPEPGRRVGRSERGEGMGSPKRKPDLTTLFWFILWPWRSQYYLVDGSCDEMARKLAYVIADGTRWRGRIEGNEFCVWRTESWQTGAWPWGEYVGSWYSSGNSCVLRIAPRPCILDVVGEAVFAFFALLTGGFAVIGGHWDGGLWFLAIGVGAILGNHSSMIIFRWTQAALCELLWYMGGKPYDFSRTKKRSQAVSSSPCPGRSDDTS